jgi:CelD/BcsL family acetyltransferase involved in cellulose biosynthesis
MPARAPFIRKSEHGYLALMRTAHPVGPVLEPFEAMWGLDCPLVGADVARLAAELAAAVDERPRPAALLLTGLERDSPRFLAAARALARTWDLRIGPSVRRYVADLSGGLDGFLARRSSNFRTALKKARRRAAERGIVFTSVEVPPAETEAAYQRLLAVDARSWKGKTGVGLQAGVLLDFYRVMLPRLAARGALRLAFAQRDGLDLAYILGGVLGSTYRGLQFAFVEGYEDCSLGNLCQAHHIAELCQSGVRRYDLGAEVEYKRRWGEIEHETLSLVALAR